MKKALLSAVAVLAVVSVAHAEPRFGAIGYTDGGVGAFVTDDMYNASITYQSYANDFGSRGTDLEEQNLQGIGLSANYKMAVDSMTAITAGVAYKTWSGQFGAVSTNGDTAKNEIEAATSLDLNVGIEKSITSNLLITGEISVYNTESVDVKDASSGDPSVSSSIFGSGRFGIAYLF